MIKYTPHDLEMLVKRELAKTKPSAAEEVRIQILRGREGWYPVCHFKKDRSKEDQSAIADLVSSIGRQLAPDHELIG
ncbi:hypothetical protein SAMN03159423_4525 [Bradyrhizobium sp. NFR13]|jgi:hypothetical protein|uniref:hypothetical protein n=1 Tax=Bradyrhizobium sp. NFR13 TaxID=1566285 RepID=UPI0008EE24DD|nr:hypothetical protein [Bradyrhizobium sp. NFR13]SFL93807.1 hypothetical protein SAMN03159423_4525 [Bradyrhizobium sp. NFR13]